MALSKSHPKYCFIRTNLHRMVSNLSMLSLPTCREAVTNIGDLVYMI